MKIPLVTIDKGVHLCQRLASSGALLYLCLFVVLRSTREFLTHTKTSPLPVKGSKCWTMLGTHGHYALRVLSMLHPLWYGGSVYNGRLRFLWFVWGLLSHSRIFPSYGDVNIAGEGRKFWPILGIHGHWAVRVL